MGYVESNLGKDEKILARITHSKAAIIGVIVEAVIVIGITLGIHFGVGALGDWLQSLDGAPDFLETIRIVVQVIVLAIGIFLALGNVIGCALEIRFNQLVVTNKRLLGRKGMISKTIIDMPLTKVDNIQARNGLFGALFHYGDLEILSAGSQRVVDGNTISNLKYDCVKNTEEFRRTVLAAINKAKEEEREAQAEAQAETMRQAQERMQAENKS